MADLLLSQLQQGKPVKVEKETILTSECISKKDILDSINIVFNRKININDKDDVIFNKFQAIYYAGTGTGIIPVIIINFRNL